jgi:hypothetical protein
MGYFSNGTEGDEYRAALCDRCVRGAGLCPVWTAHLMGNYSQHSIGVLESVLNELIPRGPNGENLQCRLFEAAQ